MRREKKLTKRERKALAGPRPAVAPPAGKHIHCVACGKHLDPHEVSGQATAVMVKCRHGTTFASCVDCRAMTQALLDEHDDTGKPVQVAAAWH